jgi:acetylornithine deacetylase
MLQTLVSEPSVSCTDAAFDQSNLNVINHLATWLRDLGFTVEIHELPGKPGKANMIATRAGQSSGDDGGLVFAGHTDTVPCDETRWHKDPFNLTQQGDLFYGLGTCDMKGFFPIALAAAQKFADSKLLHPLTIVATCDEESTMAGARYLTEQGKPRAAAAVIGEPTSMQPIHAHKGIMMQSITLEGRSGHSSNPALGNNALDAMHAIMGEMILFRQELAARYSHPAFEVSVPTLNLGCMRAGDNPNRICEHAELQMDLRLIPGMDYETTLGELQARLEPIAEAHATPISFAPFCAPIPPYETPGDGELVRTLEEYSGRSAGTVAFGTEAPFFASLGMETVVFGPGSIDQAHQPDEYLDATQISPATAILARLIEKYCRA